MDELSDENENEKANEMIKMGEQIGAQIQNQLMKMEQNNMRRLIVAENEMSIVGFRKCIFYNEATKVCVEYNDLNQMVFLDVLMMDSNEQIAHNDENIHYFVEEHEIEND